MIIVAWVAWLKHNYFFLLARLDHSHKEVTDDVIGAWANGDFR
jgi:hypothetical protein